MGRTRNFDEQQVLERAMLAFWKNGYKNTTVRTLESEMGINQFSIYATFKNKKNLYHRALLQYRDRIHSEFLGSLRQERCNLDDVESFFKRFALCICRGQVPGGCMMVNSLREIQHFDPAMQQVIKNFFNSMKMHFRRALKNSADLSPNLPGSLDECAEYLVGIAQSLSVYSRMKSEKEIEEYLRFALNVIRK